MAEAFVLVRVRDRKCALPVSEVAETLRTPAVTGNRGDVLGLMGFVTWRGKRVALLDLGLLLGYTGGDASVGRCVAVRVGAGVALLAVAEVIGVRPLGAEAMTKIELPGGQERLMGQFDMDFARVLEAGGLVKEEMLVDG